jgi:hypothetical protein
MSGERMEALGGAVELVCVRGEDDVWARTVSLRRGLGCWGIGGIGSLVD